MSKQADQVKKSVKQPEPDSQNTFEVLKAIEKTLVANGHIDQAGATEAIMNMGKPGGMTYAEMRSKYG